VRTDAEVVSSALARCEQPGTSTSPGVEAVAAVLGLVSGGGGGVGGLGAASVVGRCRLTLSNPC
jgi:hypothetical protein